MMNNNLIKLSFYKNLGSFDILFKNYFEKFGHNSKF